MARKGSVVATEKLMLDDDGIYTGKSHGIEVCARQVQHLLGTKPKKISMTIYEGNVPSKGVLLTLRKNTINDDWWGGRRELQYSFSERHKGRIKGRMYWSTQNALEKKIPELGNGEAHEFTLAVKAIS